MADGRILVAGATGQLGGAVARQLLEAGVPIRALARDPKKLAPLADLGAEIAAVDLLDARKLKEACQDIRQIVSTVNNNMRTGAQGPGRVDVTAHQNLAAAARNGRVTRLAYVSFRGVEAGDPVDIFRFKWYIEDAIRRSGVPYVFIRPTFFMDVWISHIYADHVRKKGSALIFGDGTAVENYIAVEDVARYVVRILEHEEIVNETVTVGGPSNLSINDVATLLEKHFGATGRRKHVPVAMLKLLPMVVRLFDEVSARRMMLGHYAATRSTPFTDWKASAERFGVSPKTVETFIEALER